MANEIASWLADIRQAIQEINQFLPPTKNFFAFQGDMKTKRAIERNIEIIGEAVNRIVKQDPSFPLKHARKIVNTSNRISHGYDAVSDEIIWTIVVKDIPALEAEVSDLLSDLN